MKVVFFGTSKYCLPILDALKNNFDLMEVVVMPDRPVGRKKIMAPCATKTWAIENNVPFSETLDTDCDFGVVADYGRIIKPEVFSKPRLGLFNIHFSKLPDLRGASPVQTTLLRGDTTAWITIIKINEGLDTGPILWQKEYPISPDDTTETLYTRLFKDVAKEIPIINFEGKLIEQDHTKATFCKMLTREDGFIDYKYISDPQNYNKFRAYTPWPGIWSIKDGKRMKILKCHLGSKGDGLILDLVQFEGKKPTKP